MKNCLIIAHARSGSSNLCRSIASANNLNMCFEPLPRPGALYYHSCTKVIITRRPVEFFYELAKRYEKVVLLSRRDTLAAAESLVYLKTSGHANVDVKWSELTSSQKVLVPERLEQIRQDKINIETLSSFLDIPIDYYEDIYTEHRLKDSSIKLDIKFFHPSKKCKVKRRDFI